MDNSVAAIIEMDKKARAVSDEAAAKAEAVLAKAKAKKESLSKESSDRLAEENKQRFAELKAASDKEIAAAEKQAEERCRLLDEKMSAGRDAWKKEIIGRILSFEN